MAIIGDEPCPRCREMGRDKTGNHLMVYEDGGKYCNRCRLYVPPKGEGRHMIRHAPPESVDDIRGYAEYNGEPIRGIRNAVRALYGCRVKVDEATGEPLKVFYPKGKGYKARVLADKEFYSIGNTKKPGLIGKGVTRSRTLVITGGEEDMMAAYQMLKDASPNNYPSVVSLPDGESSLGAITQDIDYILSHDNILLCLDMDEVGQASTEKAAALIDRPVRVIKMEHKDPNECLLLGAEQGFVRAYMEAKILSPGGIVHVSDVIEEALEKTENGVPFPWPSLTRETYGMRGGEGYYIGAGVKCGKSEWLNQLVKHLVQLKKKCFIVKGEEVVKKSVRKLAGKLLNVNLTNPNVDVPEEERRAAMMELDKYVLLYDRVNSLDWEDIKFAIKHAVIVEGCKFVFIDPITCFTDGMEGSEANRFLQQFSRELDQLSKDLDFTYFCFCHLNNPTSGPEHNRGGKVLTGQFTGSRAMSRATSYMIGIERNKDPELDEREQNTSYFVLLDDRENGNVCRFPVYYDKETGEYLEPENQF